ncbi:hypothetical protein FHG87_009130 [Trinorchestia longiramus]|nr:hypothetical protein FHG87_009130 [Trinorchestia longiramus]
MSVTVTRLLLLLVIMVCSGSGWWLRWRHSTSSISSPVAQVTRRRSQRQRVYPRYHHPLDTAPPSYAEVMRRLSEYPQARPLQHGGVNHADIGWITSPPPPYETIHDLRQQETKLDQEIELEESPCVPRPEREMLRRGVSARERRKLSARQRIRMLLGASNSRHCNATNQTVFAITPGSSTQPVAWSYNTANLPVMHPLPSLDLLPPYRPSNYPYSLPPPYLHQTLAGPPRFSNVDKWSRNDCQLRASSSTFSRPFTAAHANFDHLPGGVCGDENSSVETNVSPEEMEKVFEDIRSPLSPRVEDILPSTDMPGESNNDSSRGLQPSRISSPNNSPTNEERREVLLSEDSGPVLGEASTSSSFSRVPRVSSDMTHMNTASLTNSNLPTPLSSNSKYSTRPISSTALPTPGLAASSSNIPGTTINTECETDDGKSSDRQCVSTRNEPIQSRNLRTYGESSIISNNLPVVGGSPTHEFSFHPRSSASSVGSEEVINLPKASNNASNEELSDISESVSDVLPAATSSAVNGRSLSLPTSALELKGQTAVSSCKSDQSMVHEDSISQQVT